MNSFVVVVLYCLESTELILEHKALYSLIANDLAQAELVSENLLTRLLVDLFNN